MSFRNPLTTLPGSAIVGPVTQLDTSNPADPGMAIKSGPDSTGTGAAVLELRDGFTDETAHAEVTVNEGTLTLRAPAIGMDPTDPARPLVQLAGAAGLLSPAVILSARQAVLTLGQALKVSGVDASFTGTVTAANTPQGGSVAAPALAANTTWNVQVTFAEPFLTVPAVTVSTASYRYIGGASNITKTGFQLNVANYSPSAGAAAAATWVAVP